MCEYGILARVSFLSIDRMCLLCYVFKALLPSYKEVIFN